MGDKSLVRWLQLSLNNNQGPVYLPLTGSTLNLGL